ncbi:MAG: GntR family transcriptional regulator [Rubrivivax sp.]|nr:GntR family transcriptional regulator [Rubrivivax sp.]
MSRSTAALRVIRPLKVSAVARVAQAAQAARVGQVKQAGPAVTAKPLRAVPHRGEKSAHDTTTQRIVDAITTAIVERRLMPGTKLAEQPIADIFKVSRTLVRQALNRLSRDHLVTLAPARGAFVAQPSVDEAQQVFAVRQMIEAQMVRQLCKQITAPQLAQLRAHLAQEAAALARTDVSGRTRLLADFHVLLARLLGNEVLAQLLADLLSRCSLIALMYQSAHSAEHSAAEHVTIVDAIARRDTRTAARLMQSHLGNVHHNLQHQPRTGDFAQRLQAR